VRRSGWVWPLLALLLFLAFGGLYGGVAMLLDPSGHSLGMDDVLALLPIGDFVLPGLFLLLVMGVAPLGVAYGLLLRPAVAAAAPLERLTGHHWAWTGTIVLAAVLAVWLTVQGFWIGFQWPIQFVTAANGAAILVLALLPAVRREYAV
jgi:hypothetical protein